MQVGTQRICWAESVVCGDFMKRNRKNKAQTIDKTCCDLSTYCSNITNYHKYVAIEQGVSSTNDINMDIQIQDKHVLLTILSQLSFHFHVIALPCRAGVKCHSEQVAARNDGRSDPVKVNRCNAWI